MGLGYAISLAVIWWCPALSLHETPSYSKHND